MTKPFFSNPQQIWTGGNCNFQPNDREQALIIDLILSTITEFSPGSFHLEFARLIIRQER